MVEDFQGSKGSNGDEEKRLAAVLSRIQDKTKEEIERMTPGEHLQKMSEIARSIEADVKDLQDMIQDFKRDPFGFGMINPRV